MAKSTYFSNAVLNILRATNVTAPATIYVALSSTATTDGGGITEPSGNGYARQAVTFGAPSSDVVANTGAVQFAASGGNWGTMTHWALYDASSGGNMLHHAALTAQRTINDGQTATFAIGALTVTEN